MDKNKLLHLIEDDYALLKRYERGDCHGANRKQLQPSIASFVAVVNRFYTSVTELYAEVFTLDEQSMIEDCIRAVDRNSQNKDIGVVIRVLMYNVETVMKMVKSKQD